MNPDSPMTPREQLEMRLTALLMGELSPAEADALRAQILNDPRLAILHARLKKAVELLREVNAMPAEPVPAEPLQLSPERRAKLLAHFKTSPTPPQPARIIPMPRRDWSWLASTGIAAALVAFISVAFFNTVLFRTVSEPPDFALEPAGAFSPQIAMSPPDQPPQFAYEASPANPRLQLSVDRPLIVSTGNGILTFNAKAPQVPMPVTKTPNTSLATTTTAATRSGKLSLTGSTAVPAETAPRSGETARTNIELPTINESAGISSISGTTANANRGAVIAGVPIAPTDSTTPLTLDVFGSWTDATNNTPSTRAPILRGNVTASGGESVGLLSKKQDQSTIANANGTFVLGGNNTYTGGTTVQGGTVTLNAGATTFSGSSNTFTAGGTLGSTAPMNNAFTGNISGAGGLTKSGAGTITMGSGSTTLTPATPAAPGLIVNGGDFPYSAPTPPIATTGSLAEGVRSGANAISANAIDALLFGAANEPVAGVFAERGRAGAFKDSDTSVGQNAANATFGDQANRGIVLPQTPAAGEKPVAPPSEEQLARLRHFATASSRAPELNLFGRPRVSQWPIRNETAGELQPGQQRLYASVDELLSSSDKDSKLTDLNAPVVLPDKDASQATIPTVPAQISKELALTQLLQGQSQNYPGMPTEPQSAPQPLPALRPATEDLSREGRSAGIAGKAKENTGSLAVPSFGEPAAAAAAAAPAPGGPAPARPIIGGKPVVGLAPRATPLPAAKPMAEAKAKKEAAKDAAPQPTTAPVEMAKLEQLEKKLEEAQKQEGRESKPDNAIDALTSGATPALPPVPGATPLSREAQAVDKAWQRPLRRFDNSIDNSKLKEVVADLQSVAVQDKEVRDILDRGLGNTSSMAAGRAVESEVVAGNQISQQAGPNLLRDLAVASLKNEKIRETLKKHGYNVQTGELAASLAPAPSASAIAQEDERRRKAQATAATPQPEVQTSANAFSTFSLNVSDVSFKLASASLDQGKMPDPATVRSEEFINAFDYRDPEPAPGNPLAFASERARYPFAQNRDLLRLSVKTAAAGRTPGRPLNLVLLLDNSGSMERADRVRIIREALRVLCAQLQPQDKVSIVAFARTPHLWADGIAGNKAGEMVNRVGEITPQGGTNLSAALDLGYATALRHYQVGSINRVVLLTDGAANLGNVDPESLKKKVEEFRKQGVALDCFGIGWEGLDDEVLETLSRNGDGRYGFINTPEEATAGFAAQLAGALRVAASDVKVQVEFNPQRVTAYRQIGYAKHQLTKEQFRDNTVDAAEIGAAESGDALYAIEVNPRGEGDLATVRVRFKVPGTSDYREHAWPVTYNGPAQPLEQSSTSLRLAATASAFAEWLVGSPYAMEVTPDRLLGLINGVPAATPSDPRPGKLEWMIRQAKSLSGR